MNRATMARAAVAGFALVTLISCAETGGPFGADTFRAQYAAARGFLEEGKYDRAQSRYEALIPRAGPLTARLRLEYAHALLRGGEYGRAVQEATALAQGQKGKARAAALAVQGTGLHELGLEQLDKGDTALGRDYLQKAEAAMATVVKHHPDLDPLGALAARRAQIKVRLKAL